MDQRLSSLGEAALEWVGRGWRVFPLVPGAKKPLVKHGVTEATNDINRVLSWWLEWPDANIGGALDHRLVVDVDPKSGGHLTWQTIIHRYGEPVTQRHVGGDYSGIRSTHYIFTNVGYENVEWYKPGLGKGIDFLWSAGMYIVLPPSRHPTGVDYEEVSGTKPIPLPPWIYELARKVDRRQHPEADTSGGLAKLLDQPPSGPDSGRNIWLTSVAGHLAKIHPFEDGFRKNLAAINGALESPLPTAEVQQIATSIWTTEKRSELLELSEQVRRIKLRRQAEEIVRSELAAERLRRPDPIYGSLQEFFEADIPEPTWIVDQLAQVGHNVVLTAQYKTGKTTLLVNLAKSLADRTLFLGTFPVGTLTGCVGMWDYEMSKSQFRSWLAEAEIQHPEQIVPLSLRGSSWPVNVEAAREEMSLWLISHDIKYWLIDPWSGLLAHAGLSENSNDEARMMTDILDGISRGANLDLLVVASHTGRGRQEEGAEHARGATRLDDWADARWVMTKTAKESGATRHFYAEGRDVELDEGELTLQNRTLAFGERSRADVRAESKQANEQFDDQHWCLQMVAHWKAWIKEHPGTQVTGRMLKEQILPGPNNAEKGRRLQVGEGLGFWHHESFLIHNRRTGIWSLGSPNDLHRDQRESASGE